MGSLNTLFFVEAVPDSFEKGEGIVIALCPEVVVELSQRGIPYLTCEEFFSLEDTLAVEVKYAELFNKWIDLLDAQLLFKFNGLKTLNIRPARLYGYYLQLLIDSFILRVIEINKILAKFNPREVVFLDHGQKELPVDYKLVVKGCSLYSLVVPFLCRKYNIRYDNVSIKNTNRAKPKPDLLFFYRTLRRVYGSLKKCLRDFKISSSGHSMLILYRGWGIERIASEFRAKGFRCIYNFKKYQWMEKNLPISIKSPDLDMHISLFDNFAGVQFAVLLTERLNYFVEKVCPNLESAVEYYISYFKKQNIKFVITPYKINFDDFAIMAAATASKTTLAVQLIHGYSALQIFFWQFNEQPCNLYLVFDPELKMYFVDHVFRKSDTRVELVDVWTQRCRELKVNARRKGERKNVLYIPTVIGHPLYRFDSYGYTDIWYFKYQQALLKYFSTEKEMNFVYKPFPIYNSTSELLKNTVLKGDWANISYARDDLFTCMKSADYAVIDIPSTPLYETVTVGISTCCLYQQNLRIRNSAKEFLGDIVQSFSTPEDAVQKISRFLRDDPKKYVLDIPVCERNAGHIIERYFKD